MLIEFHTHHIRISVLLSPVEQLKTMPKCHIYAMEHDVLRDEEILFYNAAKRAGANVDLTIFEGAMHIEQSDRATPEATRNRQRAEWNDEMEKAWVVPTERALCTNSIL